MYGCFLIAVGSFGMLMCCLFYLILESFLGLSTAMSEHDILLFPLWVLFEQYSFVEHFWVWS